MPAVLTSGWFLENAWLIPLIPGIGFAVILLVGKRLPMQGSEVGIATMAASLVIATGAAFQWIQRVDSAHDGESEGALAAAAGFARNVFPAAQEAGHSEPFIEPVIRKWVWWQNGGFEFGLGQHIDGLAIVLLFLVAFISLLVQIYSTEYVKGDRRYTHFFAAITLFSAGMLVMVLAENMVQLILGWEIMGLCSFLLIGHWWEDAGNSRAAVKAFLTVRVGDVGLLVGTAILFFGANAWATERGSNGFSIHAISGWALSGDGSDTVLLWAAIALFIACIGKSGQFPLHTWLPDAMAGPTPVSSLLHSSTMVVAGVFLVARLYPVFFEGLDILDSGVNLIAVIGGITIVIAAALAFVQNDIKRVLAYSTVSQLGYMMMGLGVGAWTPAVFHLFTHAFFKCCLFLCAGSVSHSGSHHSFDMKKDMGGLFKKMPITAWTWILATAALCGVPFFSGFFSKDEIIDNADHNGYPVFFVVGLIGAAMTAAYMTRATYLTFFGKPRGAAAGEHHGDEHGEEHEMAHVDDHTDEHAADVHGFGGAVVAGGDHHERPHESPWRITAPLIILATCAVFAGYLNAPATPFKTEKFAEWVEPRGVEVPAAEATAMLAVGSDGTASGETAPAESEEVAAEETHAEEAGAEEEAHGASGCGFDVPHGGVCFAPSLSHAEFKWSKALPSILLVAFGGLLSLWICIGIFSRDRFALKGLTTRFAPARWGHTFLVNKYYLDHLYEKVIVHGIAHPIARAAYWTNQHVLDGIVNGAGKFGRRSGEWVYRNIDQRVVDGAVNGSGLMASESGHALQPVQSGKVNQYGALLFGAAAVAAIVLVILNV
ncbi:MAG TPA: NADH-quinone oxidoreductase subunit L [Ilumatobacteraceae bacterium]|nr:NADH-quinone oxidoreductase subunit L [Ilumatobacteraceae bacterium]